MKFIVDSLPYYLDTCPFLDTCLTTNCPRYWDKYFVSSENNPHECEHLKELSKTN